MIKLNTIKGHPNASKNRKRLGRGQGSGQGTRGGRGNGGQLSRSGGTVQPGFEGGQTPLYRRLPKRGFKNFGKKIFAEINLKDLDNWDEKTEVTLATLQAASKNSRGAMVKGKGRFDALAVLGTGDLKKPLTFKAHRISKAAKEKIEKAGGKAEVLKFG